MKMMKHYIIYVLVLMLPVLAMGQDKFERGILMELYTGQNCASCPLASDALKKIMEGHEDNERLVWISHHAGYLLDSLSIRESVRLSAFYGISGAPTLVYNRSLFKMTGKPKLGQSAVEFQRYNELHRDYDDQNRSFVEAEIDLQADISLDMDVSYDETTRNLSISVYGDKNSSFDASSPSLSVFLVQKNWTGVQNMGYGEYKTDYVHFNPVMHMCSSYYLGDVLTFDGNGKYSKQFEMKLPQTMSNYEVSNPVGKVELDVVPENLFVVAFISNLDETEVGNINYDRGNTIVYNAIRKPLIGGNSGLNATEDSNRNIYYSEGRFLTDKGYKDIIVYNLSGQAVENCGLERGIYIVKVTDRKGAYVVKAVAE